MSSYGSEVFIQDGCIATFLLVRTISGRLVHLSHAKLARRKKCVLEMMHPRRRVGICLRVLDAAMLRATDDGAPMGWQSEGKHDKSNESWAV